jgi:hypothetical protein
MTLSKMENILFLEKNPSNRLCGIRKYFCVLM